jgi:hypothetical protein
VQQKLFGQILQADDALIPETVAGVSLHLEQSLIVGGRHLFIVHYYFQSTKLGLLNVQCHDAVDFQILHVYSVSTGLQADQFSLPFH